MGPSIILDKSALQMLRNEDISELSRYFYIVIPHVLLLEILADLVKPKISSQDSRRLVESLAGKVPAMDGYVNAHAQGICLANLLGEEIRMDRRPIVTGARTVVSEDGSRGLFLDVQPEMDALRRWAHGNFSKGELKIAKKWRGSSVSTDLEGFRRKARELTEWVRIDSLVHVKKVVDAVLEQPEAQSKLLDNTLRWIPWTKTVPAIAEWTIRRWVGLGRPRLQEFAPYASHCAKVSLTFETALVQGLIGTRHSNWIDMEYFLYSPFAHVFASGDSLHRKMASVLLAEDQTFVWSEDLRKALHDVAVTRGELRASGSEDWRRVEPPEGSLIHTLWMKHLQRWKKSRGDLPQRERSPKEQEELLSKANSIKLAIDKALRRFPARRKWPCE